MKILQAIRLKNKEWAYLSPKITLKEPLVLVLSSIRLLESKAIYEEIKTIFPDGHIVFGSTSGEILGKNVYMNEIAFTAIEFEKSSFLVHSDNVANYDNDERLLGESLMGKFPQEDLRHVFIISEGVIINGSHLISGLGTHLKAGVNISGGLCGDGGRFERTLASYNAPPREGEVVAIGFYGETLEISFGSCHGWTAFGPERIITKSKDNILYELDGKPALDLYKKYLGDKARELPRAALLFPLSVRIKNDNKKNHNKKIVRTILNIDEKENAMILAGDIPERARVQLMMSTVDDIVAGAAKAATHAMRDRSSEPDLAILVSCVGRKLVMDQRTEEEVEEVMETIGSQAKVTGFYSNGEMAPFTGEHKCQLHNQTMTLTLFSE